MDNMAAGIVRKEDVLLALHEGWEAMTKSVQLFIETVEGFSQEPAGLPSRVALELRSLQQSIQRWDFLRMQACNYIQTLPTGFVMNQDCEESRRAFRELKVLPQFDLEIQKHVAAVTAAVWIHQQTLANFEKSQPSGPLQ